MLYRPAPRLPVERIFSKSSGKTSVRIAQTTVYGGRAP